MASKRKVAEEHDRSGLSAEHRRAIERHVPVEMRWVAAHPFMSNSDSRAEFGTGKEWLTAAKKQAATPCPSGQALNMLAWAIDSADKFWADYNRRCESAIKRHELDREKKLATIDTPEKLAALKASLDNYLAAHGLSRSDMPAPQFVE
jgi:hypothetical protein